MPLVQLHTLPMRCGRHIPAEVIRLIIRNPSNPRLVRNRLFTARIMMNAGSRGITRHRWVSTQLSYVQPRDSNRGTLAQVPPYQES